MFLGLSKSTSKEFQIFKNLEFYSLFLLAIWRSYINHARSAKKGVEQREILDINSSANVFSLQDTINSLSRRQVVRLKKSLNRQRFLDVLKQFLELILKEICKSR